MNDNIGTEKSTSEDISCFKHPSIVGCDTETSFSKYKSMLIVIIAEVFNLKMHFVTLRVGIHFKINIFFIVFLHYL